MHMSALESPSAFDQLAYANPAFEPPISTPLGRVRAAQMAFVRQDVIGMREALTVLPDIPAAPARGISLLLRATLGDAEGVADQQVWPSGHAALELECACYSAAAIGTANAMLARYEMAQQHLMLARTLAQALGLQNRLQNLTFEWARVSNLRGQPQPETIRQQLLEPMPAGRRAWGQRTHAESLMGLGCYSEALQSLGTPEGDAPLDRALRNFLHRLLFLPVYPALDAEAPYARLSDALGRIGSGDYGYSLLGIRDDLPRDYAAVLEAVALARSRDLAQQAVRTLGRRTFAAADLSIYRMIVLMGAVGEGATLHGAALTGREAALTDQLSAQLARLRCQDEVARVIRNAGPDRFALLAFSPVAEEFPALGLNGLALITGRHVLVNGAEKPLPGRAGCARVLEALGLPFKDLQRAQNSRYNAALAELQAPVVNLGWVARACLRLSANALRLGHPNEAAGWQRSYRRVVDLLSPELQTAIQATPPLP